MKPMEITADMKNAKQARIDKLIEKQNESIAYAVKNGRHDACFVTDHHHVDSDLFSELKGIFESAGYKVYPTGIIGGVWQQTYTIAW